MAPPSLLTTLLILLGGVLLARRSGEALRRWAVPAIVIELLLGFALGNTVLPFAAIEPLRGITELGVLTLFFQVGLEVRSDLLSSRAAAVARTVALSFLAPLLAWWPLQTLFQLPRATTLLCLAVLAATGTGVTLRVLSQRGALGTPSGRLLVGVSVLDDLPAIALLSLSLSLGGRSIGGGPMGHGGWPFLLGGLAIAWLSLQLVGAWVRRRGQRPLGTLPILLILIGFAWLGETSGLTSLLGALWGGVILARLAPVEEDIRRSLALLSEVFLPLYFVGVGMRIQAATLLRPEAWTLAALLILMALFSKLICGFGINARDRAAGVDRWVVVFGLIPRGLPGLVFASTALAARVIDPLQFSALVIMVTTTTMVGLVLLERRIQRLGLGTAGD